MPIPIMAASEALLKDEKHVEENRALYRKKLDIAESIFGSKFSFYRPEGGFFLWLDVGNGETATKKLWSKAGIKVLPGEYLSRSYKNQENPGKKFIRLALVHDLKTSH